MIALTFRPSRRSWRSSPRSGSFRLATSSLARCSWVEVVALAARYLASVAGIGHGSTSSHAPRSAATWTVRTLPDIARGARSKERRVGGEHVQPVPGAGGLHDRGVPDRRPGGAGVIARAHPDLVGELDRRC